MQQSSQDWARPAYALLIIALLRNVEFDANPKTSASEYVFYQNLTETSWVKTQGSLRSALGKCAQWTTEAKW